MICKFIYKPWTQSHNLNLDIKRMTISENYQINANLDIIESSVHKGDWRCFNHALYKLTENTTPLILYNDGTASIDILKYFDQIPTPEVGALVLYTDNNNFINHYAIALTFTLFESKWGKLEVIQHQPFDVPYDYGESISFWKLKNKYNNDKKLTNECIKTDAFHFQYPYKMIDKFVILSFTILSICYIKFAI